MYHRPAPPSPYVSVVIGTYGDRDVWTPLAERAERSVPDRYPVWRVHAETLAAARNEGAEHVDTPFVVFLDADDYLAPGYLEAIEAEIVGTSPEPGMLPHAMLTPRVAYGARNRWQTPKFHREVDLRDGNWLVIGTAVPRSAFLAAGGFDDRWPIYEDWALFATLHRDGLPIVRVPDAVYRASRRESRSGLGPSRNHSLPHAARAEWHKRIHDHVWGERPS